MNETQNDLKARYDLFKSLDPYDRANERVDGLLMICIKESRLSPFISGIGSYGFFSVSDVTNYGIVFAALYRNFRKHPELDIGTKFDEALIELGNGDWLDVYCAVDALQHQLDREASKEAPFQIKDPNVYVAIKNGIIKNKEELKRVKKWRALEYRRGCIGFLKAVNKQVKKQTGNKIL